VCKCKQYLTISRLVPLQQEQENKARRLKAMETKNGANAFSKPGPPGTASKQKEEVEDNKGNEEDVS